MIKQDILEKQAKIVYLGIGSNLGNRINNIENAKISLSYNNVKIIQSSNYYETLSWPNPNYPKFYNVVLKVKTNLKVLELLTICKQIEISLGRKKTSKNSPRICDIDILDYDQNVFKKYLNQQKSKILARKCFFLFTNCFGNKNHNTFLHVIEIQYRNDKNQNLILFFMYPYS